MEGYSFAGCVRNEVLSAGNPVVAKGQMRFFKCGPGEYAEGDVFAGVKMPQVRTIVSWFSKTAALSDLEPLYSDGIHEVRMAGYLLLEYLFASAMKRKDYGMAGQCVEVYLSNMAGINNWDLVDLTCYKILGRWVLHTGDSSVLYRLAASGNMWEQRIAMVSVMALVKAGYFEDCKKLAVMLAGHPHDLLHKAVGWMLREMGKVSEKELTGFLDENGGLLCCTAMRYAIERLAPSQREFYRGLARRK